MKMHSLLLLAVLIAAPGEAEGPDMAATATLSPHNLPEQIQLEANFRRIAGQVQAALVQESCRPRLALRRASLLQREIEATRAFETRLEGGPAAAHWRVAGADIAAGDIRCWDDSDPAFAAHHVEMAREIVDRGLVELTPMLPRLAPAPADVAALPATDAARFRREVRDIIIALNMPCGDAGTRDSDRILAPSREALGTFRQRLRGTPYAPHFDLAAADGLYELSITVYECISQPPVAPAVASRHRLEWTRGQLAILAAAAHL